MANQQATVSFTPPANTGGDPILEYIVMAFSGVPSTETGIFATGAASPITVTGLVNGTTYIFEVYAVNAVGAGPFSVPSNPVTPMATVPTAPQNAVATAGNGQAFVVFAAPVTDGGSPITFYTATSNPGAFTGTVFGLGPITVTGLTDGTAYTFTVTATNSVGTSPASTPSNAVTPQAPPTLPTAPLSPSATAGNTQATVSFNPPLSNGGAAITSYTVTSSPGALTVSGSASPLTVTGLTNGVAYTFTVTATNSAGTGAASVATNSVTPQAPVTVPTAPLSPIATAGNAQAFVTFSAPSSDGGAAITSYTATASPGGQTGTVASVAAIAVGGLTNGTAYTFTVTATNSVGTSPASVASNSVTPAAIATVPSAPLTPAAVAGNAQATVSFSAPATNGGATITSYTVTSSPGSFTASGAASPQTVTGLSNGTAYTFTVTATNSVGTGPASVASNSVTPSPPPTVPSAPLSPSAVAGNAQATVSFSAPASTGGSPITSYTTTSSPGGLTASGAASPLTVAGLTNGVGYTFTVTATTAVGTGPASVATARVTPLGLPGAPTGATATPGNAQVSVAFTAPVSTGGAPITSYTATSNPSGITASGAASPIVVTGLTNGISYSFTVTATTSVGTGPGSAPSNSVTPATVPGAPTALVATGANASASIAFTAPGNGGSAITSYQATSNPGGLNGSAAASPVVVNGLTNGVSYTFTITATNAIGTGAASTASNAVTPSTVPGAPTTLVATGGNAQASIAFTAPSITGGSPITSYKVTSSGGQNATGASSPIVVTGLTNGVSYTFTAVATNANGNSVASSPSNAVTPATVPGAPLSPSATAGNASAIVTFSPPASNGGSAITSYTVTSSGGQSASGSGSPITVNGLTNGTAYTFTVTATNTAGTGPASVASNSVTPISPAGFVITTASEPGGTVGTAYSGSVAAGGGTSVPPYTYFTTGGLPPNVTLTASTGALGGTPSTAGSYNPGFYATDSSGTTTYPTSVTVASNDGDGANQHNGGIQTVSSVPVVANGLLVCLTTVATFGSGGGQGEHNGRGLQTTNGDAFTLKGYFAGPSQGVPPPGTNNINASQETDLWACAAPLGGTTTFQQWFGTAGYLGNNSGDNDYQAFKGYQYSTGSTLVGFGAWTAQTGTAFAGVAHNTALLSGSVALSAAQVPCRLFGFCENTSSLGTNYVATPNTVSGIAGVQVEQTWGFGGGTGANTSCYAYWNITVAGTYTPSFNQNSSTLNCFQTVGWAVKTPSTGNQTTPTKNLPIVISSGGGGGSAPTLVQLLLQGQTSQNLATDAGGNNRFQPQSPHYTMIGWLSVASATQYNIYRATIPVGSQATGTLNYGSTPYASISAAASASAYSGYVSGSGGAPYQTAVNCAYGDTVATNCVNGTRGGGPNANGGVLSPGDLWAGTGYSYKVSAVVGGVESAQSAAHYAVYVSNGLRIMYDNSFNFDPTTSATNGGTTPSGATQTLEWTTASPYFNPYCGNGATEWNLNIRPFNYMQFYIKANQAGGDLRLTFENEGDNLINGGAETDLSPYLTLVVGQYALCKVPLSVIYTDSTRGRQNAFYKCILDQQAGTQGTFWIDDWIFTT